MDIDTPAPAAGSTDLTTHQREILEFEREWWRYAGAKEQAIRAQFDCDTAAYYAELDQIIDTPAALEFDPMLVKRLRRLRAQRQRQRAQRRG